MRARRRFLIPTRTSDVMCQVTLVTKERDGLKAILASYDEEENVIASHQKVVTGIANLATPEKAKEFRIQVGT